LVWLTQLKLRKTLFLHTKQKTIMRSTLFGLIFSAVLPVLAFAQGGSLTIFSEDGDKFTLFLNGAQQNNAPQTNLRLDNLTQQYYQAKIVFEDKAKGKIEKNVSVVDAATNSPADVVYKIKNKDGEMKLRFFSTQPVAQNYTPPANVYVVHYGQPDQGTTVTQTTVTTTAGGGGGSVGITPAGGNGNVNLSINMSMGDPSTTQTTTTTTTTSYSSTSTSSGYSDGGSAAPVGCQYPMDVSNFRSAMETVKNANFEETKLSTAKSILASNCMSTDQVVQICGLFGFEQSKLQFAKSAYSRTTDPGNYFKVGNIFSFDASKTELNNFIANGGR
jgi:Domain of unknown function (DUF4476)